MLTLLLGVALATVIFYYVIVKAYDYWKDRGVPQGTPLWILHNNFKTFLRLQSIAELITSAYNHSPGTRYFGTYQLLSPVLMIKDPELLKQVTVKDFDHFTDHRSLIPENADPIWGRNLLILKGQRWRDMRSILSPSFTSSKMKAMFDLITECAEKFVQHFSKQDKDVVTVEMGDTFSRFTNDVIATTAFGVEVDSLGSPDNEFYLMGKAATDFSGLSIAFKIFGYLLLPKLFTALKVPMFDKKVSGFFGNLIDTTVKTRDEQKIIRPDMIHLMMEARKGKEKQEDTVDTELTTVEETDTLSSKAFQSLTNEDMTSQALIFFTAGFDTVSNLMCFTSYELAVNLDIQDRLRKEVKKTLEECGGKLTYEGLFGMKYMDMVVSEVLRKWPNQVDIDRVCTKPYVIEPAKHGERPLYLEKGSTLIIPIFSIHRDPENFPDPERFDPERFSSENREKIKPYAYLPFGLGPRNCIGSRFALLEVKNLLFHILLRFEILPVGETSIPLKISRKTFSLTAEDGFWLGLKRIR